MKILKFRFHAGSNIIVEVWDEREVSGLLPQNEKPGKQKRALKGKQKGNQKGKRKREAEIPRVKIRKRKVTGSES